MTLDEIVGSLTQMRELSLRLITNQSPARRHGGVVLEPDIEAALQKVFDDVPVMGNRILDADRDQPRT